MKINSFEEACTCLGLDPAHLLPDVSKQPEWLQKFTLAKIKLAVIANAMNEGKVFDWSDTNQRKWFPVFDMNDRSDPTGFGFSASNSYLWFTLSSVGARLSFFTEEDADHFGQHFIDLHRDVMLIPKA